MSSPQTRTATERGDLTFPTPPAPVQIPPTPAPPIRRSHETCSFWQIQKSLDTEEERMECEPTDTSPSSSLFGEYEREDEEDAPELRKKAWLFQVPKHWNLRWLAEPPLTRTWALKHMEPSERAIYEYLVILSPLQWLREIWRFSQKTKGWLWARKARLTGSVTGKAVGHLRGTPILTAPYEDVWSKFKSGFAMAWGSGKEVYGTQCYANDLKRLVTAVFRRQRRTDPDGMRRRKTFVFRNQEIPVIHIDLDPDVEVRHYGLLIDPWNHHRGVSPDGVVFINGTPVGVLEVKCAFAKQKALYVNIKTYYYNQLMSELYIAHRYWPQIRWCDFVVWSPQNFTVDTFTFDATYYYLWYGPRELKYYFRLHLPTIADRLKLLAQQEVRKGEETLVQAFQRVMRRELRMPPLEEMHVMEERKAPPAAIGEKSDGRIRVQWAADTMET
jgi:hypothetical protein